MAPIASSWADCAADGVRIFMPFMSSSARTGLVLLMMLAVSEFHSISTLVSLNSPARKRSKCAHSFLVPSSALVAMPGSSVSAIIGKSADV